VAQVAGIIKKKNPDNLLRLLAAQEEAEEFETGI
jgi:hypothetical protein